MARSLPSNTPFTLLLIILLCTCSLAHLDRFESTILNQNNTQNTNSNEVNFTAAGSDKISIIGQPIHLGDYVHASILIHNQGDIRDSVRLVVEGIDDSIWFGEYVEIDSGSSREISVSLLPSKVGNNEFNWSVYGPGGGIDDDLNGSFSIEVRDKQLLQIEFNSYLWTSEEGLQVISRVYLSEGVSRDIMVMIFDNDDKDNPLQSLQVSLDYGSRIIIFDLGDPIVDTLFIEAIPIYWNPIVFNSENTSTLSVNPPVTSVEIEFDNIYPQKPSENENISFEYTVTNTGNSKINSGLIRLITSDQTIIHEENFPSLLPDATYSGKIIITEWPYIQPTNVSIYFISEEYYASNWILIDSANSPQSSSLPFDIYAVSYGTVAGLTVVIMAKIVISAVVNRTPSTINDSKLRPPRESRINANKSRKQEKREVSCPLCEQRLNVPLSHEGLVRCPSCESNFEVLPLSENVSEEINLDEVQKEVSKDNGEIEILSSSSEGDMLNCPSCEQKLRVLESKRPVRARCPACRCEFMALSKEK